MSHLGELSVIFSGFIKKRFDFFAIRKFPFARIRIGGKFNRDFPGSNLRGKLFVEECHLRRYRRRRLFFVTGRGALLRFFLFLIIRTTEQQYCHAQIGFGSLSAFRLDLRIYISQHFFIVGFVFILWSARRRIALRPEILDEFFFFGVGF